MLPIPTRAAVLGFFSVLACLLIGAVSASLPATTLGAAGAIGLASALAATMPLARRARRQRLEFAWWLAQGDPGAGGGAAVPGTPFEVRCFLRHRGQDTLRVSGLDAVVPGSATRVDLDEPDGLVLAPSTRTDFTFRFVAPAVGRVVLHGLSMMMQGPLGLFEVPLYFPNPLVIKVLPQSAARHPTQARAIPGLPVERSGRSLLAPRGGGTELRELREMRPGDPFKSIAWKPSAKRGKLLVREVEEELQETRVVVLDVSGTMRGGEPGHRKLDHAIEAVAAEARRTLAGGDRFGVVTVDGRVLAHVSPRDGGAHVLRVFDALLAATEVVDEDLTDVDEDEVVAVVGRYVRQQDGLDFSTGTTWNVPPLVRHVERALASEDGKAGPAAATGPSGVMLRRFCQVRGIPLPYRPDPRQGAKGPGIAAVLRGLATNGLGPMTITCITDLDGLGPPEGLLGALKWLRLRGHVVSFVVHDGTTFGKPPGSPLGRQLADVYGRGERRRVDEFRALLAPLSIGLRVATASEAPAGLLRARTRPTQAPSVGE